ncbi:MAG: DUF935 family protein [Bacteroidia bacterium]|nr:DUF935 family protein [Bacteroidia bacterium]
MSTHSKIGKQIEGSRTALARFKDEDILVEAALRRGQSVSKLIEPTSPSLVTVDLKRWKNAWLSAKNGEYADMNLMYEVYDNIMVDNGLSSNIETRILKIQQAKFNLVNEKGEPDKEAKKLLESQWVLDFMKYCMESRFEGYRLIELFEFDEKGYLKTAKAINKYHVKAHKGIVTKYPGDETGVSYLEGPVSQYYIPVGDPNDLGILYKVAPHVLAKKYALGHWSEFNEKMGIPFRTVTTNMANTVRQAQLGVIMEKMGAAGWAVLNEGEKVELLEAYGSDPTRCFEGLIRVLDSERAMLIMGQSSTSNSDKNKGTYGSMKILQEISNDRHEADLIFLKYILNNVLLKRLPLLSPAYKQLEKLSWEWDMSVDLSVSEVVDYVVSLSEVYNIPAEFVTQKTGIPIDGLKPAQATPPPTEGGRTGAKKKSPVSSNSLDAFYGHSCSCDPNEVSAAATPSLQDETLRVARLIFDGKQKGVVDNDLMVETAKHLVKGVLNAFKTTIEDPGLSNVEMINSLRRNVWVFSGFKTHEILRAISDKLVDEKGQVREWGSFKKEVLNLDDRYNVNYLKTEYDHALVSAQQAAQWLDIQRTKEALPLLRFVATLDDRTTDICNGLNDVTLPADHDFWKTHFLPLHWHERSLIQQLANGQITDMSKVKIPALDAMFKNNVGISGVAFPKSHPYYETSLSTARKIEEAANIAHIRDAREEVRSWGKKAVAVYGNKYKLNLSEFETLTLRRSDVKDITGKSHSNAPEAYRRIMNISALFKDAKYVGWSPEVKGHEAVIKWLYYEVEIAGELSYLNVMFDTHGEYRLHSISDKQGFSIRKVKNKTKK